MTRKDLHGMLDVEQFVWWHATARNHSVTVTALLQAIAEAETVFPPEVYERASLVDARRLRRNRP